MSAQEDQPAEPIPFGEFLAESQPGTWVPVSELVSSTTAHGHEISSPVITLPCRQESNEPRVFSVYDITPTRPVGTTRSYDFFLGYQCRNCGTDFRTFAVRVKRDKEIGPGQAYKYGEYPPFGPPLPARLQRLIQPQRALFLRGFRCEKQGLGIGALAYYRRVVEEQWAGLIKQMIEAAEKQPGSERIVAELREAEQEKFLKQAVEKVKHVLPDVLMIKGHNPLTLLNAAIGEEIHGDEARALDLARTVRFVLTELAERIRMATEQKAELTKAISRLMNPETDEAAENS